MTRTVAFVVNDLSEFTFADHIRKYLPDVAVSVLNAFPQTPADYDLVVLWNLRRVIHTDAACDNVVIFHSSDLPDGRGWAPIYHTLADGAPYYTVSGIKMGAKVDEGDIVVKARLPVLPHYVAADLRRFDDEISVLLSARILDRFGGGALKGRKQAAEGSYNPRRRPQDNEIDLNAAFVDVIPHLRACEPQHPAFFVYQGQRYTVQVTPDIPAVLPSQLEIEFLVDRDDNQSAKSS